MYAPLSKKENKGVTYAKNYLKNAKMSRYDINFSSDYLLKLNQPVKLTNKFFLINL